MTADRTYDYKLYESARGHDVAIPGSDFEFPFLTRQILVIGGPAATVLRVHLVDDPEDKVFGLNVGANAFIQLPLRVDVVKAANTCSVIGLW